MTQEGAFDQFSISHRVGVCKIRKGAQAIIGQWKENVRGEGDRTKPPRAPGEAERGRPQHWIVDEFTTIDGGDLAQKVGEDSVCFELSASAQLLGRPFDFCHATQLCGAVDDSGDPKVGDAGLIVVGLPIPVEHITVTCYVHRSVDVKTVIAGSLDEGSLIDPTIDFNDLDGLQQHLAPVDLLHVPAGENLLTDLDDESGDRQLDYVRMACQRFGWGPKDFACWRVARRFPMRTERFYLVCRTGS